jgi:signal transduction histidine kinase
VAFGAFAAFVVAAFAMRLPGEPAVDAAAAGVALAAGALALMSGRDPVVVWAVVAAGGVAVLGHGRSSNVGWFALAVLGMWCALSGSRRGALGFWFGSLVLFAVEWAAEPDAGWAAWMAGVGMAVGGGLLIRHQFALVAELRAAQADLADRSRTEERNRIARELHDVVAHSLTVSLLHVAAARMAVQYDSAGAIRSLEEAERLGRESLSEVRATVGLLRVDGDTVDGVAPPLPGIAELSALTDGFRAAGADVTLTVEGEAAGLPATTGLTVYRIVQEAVTNAVKHAPGAPVAVDVRIGAAGVDLTVDSAGRPGSGSGSGLGSMRERAEALGGTLAAGPGGRGWRVHATLPVHAEPRTGTAT